MSEARQAIVGVLAAIISAAIILGGLTISLVESGARLALAPTLTITGTMMIPTSLPGEPTFTPRPTAPPTATVPVPTPANCPVPPGWRPITIQPDDTWESIAAVFGTTVAELQTGNCLPIQNLPAGTNLFVPPLPPSVTPLPPTDTPFPTEVGIAPTGVPCTPHTWWPQYQVRPGDTLSGLAAILGVSVGTLQDANCISNPRLLTAWSWIYVPWLPPTPNPHYTPTPWSSSTATITPLPTLTRTPRPTVAPSTITPTPMPTNTAPPTDTPVTPTTPVPATFPSPTFTPIPTPGNSTVSPLTIPR